MRHSGCHSHDEKLCPRNILLAAGADMKWSALIAVVVTLGLDQGSKSWALSALWPPYSAGVELLPVLNMRLGFNTGITFGLFAQSAASAVWLLVAMKLVVVAALLVWLVRTTSRMEAVALGLIIGGAIGNIVDRVQLGAVVDFLDAHFQGWHWPTFNMADVAIVCGVGCLLASAMRTQAVRPDVR